MGAPSAGRMKAEKKTKKTRAILIIDPSHLLLLSNRNQTEKSTEFKRERVRFPGDLTFPLSRDPISGRFSHVCRSSIHKILGN